MASSAIIGSKCGWPGVDMHMMPAAGAAPIRSQSLTPLERARQALAAYFMFAAADGAEISDDLIQAILFAKKEAIEQNDQRFERLMLDIGAYCDERLDDGNVAGKTARSNFLRLIGMLQRMEEASKRINKMVLFARGIPESGSLSMLSVCWNELDAVKPGLFRELLVDGLLASDLPGRMGRKRLTILLEGLESLSRQTGTIRDIQENLAQVEQEEQTLVRVVTTIQETIGNRYGWLAGDGERDTIKRIVSIELRRQRLLTGDIPGKLFDVGLRLAKSSLMYTNTLLPIIVAQGDSGLREEFIRDSGLDRLLVEELEEFWCTRENIPQHQLAPLRGRS